jgi:hypothetical protein
MDASLAQGDPKRDRAPNVMARRRGHPDGHMTGRRAQGQMRLPSMRSACPVVDTVSCHRKPSLDPASSMRTEGDRDVADQLG